MIENIKIVALSENKSKDSNIFSEHGLSFYIKVEGEEFLFDTGASDLFLKNAKILDIDLNKVNTVILSHSHYDHTGGLEYLMNKQVYIHDTFFNQKYKKINNDFLDIGVPKNKIFYERVNNHKFIQINNTLNIANDIYLFSHFKNKDNKDYFYIKKNNELKKDMFLDEIAMVIKTIKGLIIITGCSHTGIINIINKAISITKKRTIYALFGGLHLSKLSKEENIKIAKNLLEYKIEHIGISHCTGDMIIEYLSTNKAFNFNIGDVFAL